MHACGVQTVAVFVLALPRLLQSALLMCVQAMSQQSPSCLANGSYTQIFGCKHDLAQRNDACLNQESVNDIA